MDFITALGKLLSSSRLRELYKSDTESLANKFNINEAERSSFINLDITKIEAQAKTLLSKRFHEVVKILPGTTALLGELAHQQFINYSESFWPEGVDRHLLDATSFIQYLKRNHICFCKAEYNKVKFNLKRKKLSIHYLSSVEINGRARKAIQVIYQKSRSLNELYFFLG
ncbi:MAG: hypothetical protein OEY09_16080 [Gammaproteobacteria bacterium]|nr:hypothetical protein [Gammaproteobacteria bacterium]